MSLTTSYKERGIDYGMLTDGSRRYAEGKKRQMEQIKGVHVEVHHPDIAVAVQAWNTAEEARSRQEERIQGFGQHGRQEILNFLSTRSQIIAPALKSFTKMQGWLAGHTAAAIIEFRNLHLATTEHLRHAQAVPVPSMDHSTYLQPSVCPNLLEKQRSKHKSVYPDLCGHFTSVTQAAFQSSMIIFVSAI